MLYKSTLLIRTRMPTKTRIQSTKTYLEDRHWVYCCTKSVTVDITFFLTALFIIFFITDQQQECLKQSTEKNHAASVFIGLLAWIHNEKLSYIEKLLTIHQRFRLMHCLQESLTPLVTPQAIEMLLQKGPRLY